VKTFCSLAAIWLLVALGESGAQTKPAWQVEWDRVVEAAKKEGQVSVWGPEGTWPRKALAEEFEKKFPEIKVDLELGAGAKWPKYKAEREAGLFNLDVHIGGVGSAVTSLYVSKALRPIEGTFILPEVKDNKAWWQEKFHFGDAEGKYVFVFTVNPTPVVAYNTKLVDPSEIKSAKDLLNPKWKGKIVMYDPTVRGPGNARWDFYLQTMGREYLEALAKQIVLTRDHRQASEWIASGKYPLGTGLDNSNVADFTKKGAPIDQIANFAEGNYLSAAWGTVNFVDRAPHPNAAKVYINWILSKEGQLAWQKHSGYNSARMDISKDSVDSFNRMVKGLKYLLQFTAESIKYRDEVSTKVAKEIIKG
jgi:iron(III) transport system substrate-binding protein